MSGLVPRLAVALAQHVALSLSALAISLAIAVPLGIVVARSRRFGGAILAVFGTIYTIPSLAALALLVPVLGLGFGTALVALVAYAQMILTRSVATAVRGVPPALVDAAQGLGLSPLQRFYRVELPQALPSIVGGLRIATVAIIAIANLAAWIDAGGLGTLIFDGLRRDIPAEIIAGALGSATLALIADGLLRALEETARKRAAIF
ncbi:MAG: ABC transporter permease [Candidatus Eremiobacteraeota bacterium]|nr:ABC transporter permease [Candidatus Eremiobacteraeota bacterium]